jgi:WD40 repeat protein
MATTVLQGRFAAVVSTQQSVQLWDLIRGEQFGEISAGSDTVLRLACTTTSRGQAIAVGYTAEAIWMWDLKRQTQIGGPIRHANFRYHPHGLSAICAGDRPFAVTVHTEVDYDAMGDGSFEIYYGEVRVWDLMQRVLVGECQTPRGDFPNAAICIHRHRRPVAVTGGYDRTLRMWDVARNKLISEWPVHGEINCLAYSTDGALVVGIDSDVLVADIN